MKQYQPFTGKWRCGFTLVEVLMVVTIVAAAGVIVVPHMLRPGTMSIQAAGRMIVADILFAQNEAIAHQKVRKVIFDVLGGGYRLTDENDQTISASWIGGGLYVVSIRDDPRFGGVALTGFDFGDSAELVFDDLGSPKFGGHVALASDALRYRIQVAPLTGRVTIEPQ